MLFQSAREMAQDIPLLFVVLWLFGVFYRFLAFLYQHVAFLYHLNAVFWLNHIEGVHQGSSIENLLLR